MDDCYYMQVSSGSESFLLGLGQPIDIGELVSVVMVKESPLLAWAESAARDRYGLAGGRHLVRFGSVKSGRSKYFFSSMRQVELFAFAAAAYSLWQLYSKYLRLFVFGRTARTGGQSPSISPSRSHADMKGRTELDAFMTILAEASFGGRAGKFVTDLRILLDSPERFFAVGLDKKYKFSDYSDLTENSITSKSAESRALILYLQFALVEDFSIEIDWAGEEEQFQIRDFVNARIASFGEAEIPSATANEWEDKIVLEAPERGMLVPKLLSLYGQLIRDKNLTLAIYDDGSDQFHPFLFQNKFYEAIEASDAKRFGFKFYLPQQ